jgi:hypothetical protein
MLGGLHEKTVLDPESLMLRQKGFREYTLRPYVLFATTHIPEGLGA